MASSNKILEAVPTADGFFFETSGIFGTLFNIIVENSVQNGEVIPVTFS